MQKLSLITQKNLNMWLEDGAIDSESKAEIQVLLNQGDLKELEDRFYRDLEFGTGGLRGIMGAGTNRMNVFNIRKAAHAMSIYLLGIHKGVVAQSLKIAISYDSRHKSRDFAIAAAEVFAGHGLSVLITREMRPVPMLSFMVRHFRCVAGVCVTASHNPPQYNGFKVYWDTGGQVVPPHDQNIISAYKSVSTLTDIPTLPFRDGLKKDLIRQLGEELDRPYFLKLKELSLRPNTLKNFSIVYTPLHGTGLFPVTHALKEFGFSNVIVVPEQQNPDGNFPTVKFPNPEEKEALTMAIQLAKSVDADLVLGTDPDADRIGIVVREGTEFVFFNGNQIGCLLIEYFLSGLKDLKRLPLNPMIVKTIVTTDLQRAIAEYYGVACFETLTGFKWICQFIEDVQTGKTPPIYNYVCGGEESYGFLAGDFVRDKDAVAACCIAAEMTAYYKSKGMTLSDVLTTVFARHGVYQETLYTMTLPGKDGLEDINRIMHALRFSPPRHIADLEIVQAIDYLRKEVFSFSDGSQKLVGTTTVPSSDVLQFVLKDNTKVSIRPSGTEPKIKFYVSAQSMESIGKGKEDILNAQKACLERAMLIQAETIQYAKAPLRGTSDQPVSI